MEKKQERRGLGRGLSALMADITATAEKDSQGQEARRSVVSVAVENLFPNPNQPRRNFTPEDLESLASSIKQKGILQPLIVRSRHEPGTYEIVAGERRWRAAQIAQLHELPVLVRNFTDTEVLEVAIIENIQRADLNAIEEAAGFRQLMDRFGHTQEMIAEALSKSRSHIANLLRLLSLPEDVQGLVREGRLSAGHARALITTSNPAHFAKIAMDRGLSVRETERLVREASEASGDSRKATRRPSNEKDADTRALEADLSANLRMMVSINHEAGGERGTLTIRYNTLEDLDNLCRTLSLMDRD